MCVYTDGRVRRYSRVIEQWVKLKSSWETVTSYGPPHLTNPLLACAPVSRAQTPRERVTPSLLFIIPSMLALPFLRPSSSRHVTCKQFSRTVPRAHTHQPVDFAVPQMHTRSLVDWCAPALSFVCHSLRLLPPIALMLLSRMDICLCLFVRYSRARCASAMDRARGSQIFRVEYYQQLKTTKCAMHDNRPNR